ncbi:hypothetical protein ALC60_10271, partial [Trachymyrmex zeteki]
KYPCTNCSSTFQHKRSLLKHVKYECGQSPRFKCPYCELISKKSSNILRHIRLKHKGYEVYVQDICFCASFELTRDGFQKFNRSVRFPCMNCTSVYSTKGSLTTHLKYECGQPPRFKCPYCDLVSKKTSNVQQHIRRRHKDCVVYVQDITHPRVLETAGFAGTSDLRVRPVTEIPMSLLFPCPNCNSVFNRKNNLNKHLKYECGQLPRFKCPHCLYRSKKTSNVRAHIRGLHSGCEVYVIDLNASLNYCTLAAIPPDTRSYVLHSYSSSMTTTATTAMRTIKIKDVGKKMFPCTKCSSAFSRKGGLTYHQKNECGQEPRFSCPYCVYRAGHVSNARRHVKKCHPDQVVYAIDLGKLQKHDP